MVQKKGERKKAWVGPCCCIVNEPIRKKICFEKRFKRRKRKKRGQKKKKQRTKKDGSKKGEDKERKKESIKWPHAAVL